jgi:hypothetical protein
VDPLAWSRLPNPLSAELFMPCTPVFLLGYVPEEEEEEDRNKKIHDSIMYQA